MSRRPLAPKHLILTPSSPFSTSSPFTHPSHPISPSHIHPPSTTHHLSSTFHLQDIKESEKKWGKVTPAQAFAWDKEHLVLYTGDTMGNLRSFCMKDVVQDASMRRASYLPTSFSKVKKSHPRSAMPPFPQKGRYH